MKEPDSLVREAPASKEWKESPADSSCAVCSSSVGVFYLTLGWGSTSMEGIASCQLAGSPGSSPSLAVKYSLMMNIHGGIPHGSAPSSVIRGMTLVVSR